MISTTSWNFTGAPSIAHSAGKRGQAFLRDLLAALDELPEEASCPIRFRDRGGRSLRSRRRRSRQGN